MGLLISTDAVKTVNGVKLPKNKKTTLGGGGPVRLSFDKENGCILFATPRGEIHTFDLTAVSDLGYFGLSDLAKEVVGYAYIRKFKANLAVIKFTQARIGGDAGDIEDKVMSLAVTNEIRKHAEKFTLRAKSGGSRRLSADQVAYAVAVKKHSAFCSDISSDDVEGWEDLEDARVIAAVRACWGGYTKDVKASIRKNPYFRLEKARLELGDLGA